MRVRGELRILQRRQPRSRRAGALAAVLASCLIGATGAAASDEAVRPRLVRDINRRPGNDSRPTGFLTIGDLTFFVATTVDAGTELWRTDETQEGTILLGDICPGPTGSLPGPPLSRPPLLAFGSLLYFVASDCLGGGLWRSDGTVEGTRPILDLHPGEGAGISEPVVHGGLLYFFGTNDAGQGLWRSDGTAGGTVMVRSLTSPGAARLRRRAALLHCRRRQGRGAVAQRRHRWWHGPRRRYPTRRLQFGDPMDHAVRRRSDLPR